MKTFFAAVLVLLSYVEGQATAIASAVSTGGFASASSSAVSSIFKGDKKGYSYPKPSYYYPKYAPVKQDPVVIVRDGKKKEQKPVIVVVDDKKPKAVVEEKPKVVVEEKPKVADKKDNKKKDKQAVNAEAGATATATTTAAAPAGDCTTVAEAAAGTPELSTLVAALTEAGLVETLSDTAFVATILAPTNEAFEKLTAAFDVTLDQLLADPQLSNILLYHVIGGAAVLSGDLVDGAELTTALGQEVTVDLSNGVSFVGAGSTGTVVAADVAACSAVVHVIDEVLLPNFDIIAAEAAAAVEGN